MPVYPRTAGSGMEANSTDEPGKPSEATDVNDSTFTIPNIKGSTITIYILCPEVFCLLDRLYVDYDFCGERVHQVGEAATDVTGDPRGIPTK